MAGQKLTHFDAQGRAHMVDVGHKAMTQRQARACAEIIMAADTFALAMSGHNKKGDILTTAEIAGIMAAKNTSALIPLCHPISLSKVVVTITPVAELPGFAIEANVSCVGQTGVEMEALMAANIAALTIYDMLKAADRHMVVQNLRVVAKSGGASGDWVSA